MAKRLALILVLAILLTACGGYQESIVGRWKLVESEISVTHDRETDTEFNDAEDLRTQGTEIILTFTSRNTLITEGKSANTPISALSTYKIKGSTLYVQLSSTEERENQITVLENGVLELESEDEQTSDEGEPILYKYRYRYLYMGGE